jgi:hypothetical protein
MMQKRDCLHHSPPTRPETRLWIVSIVSDGWIPKISIESLQKDFERADKGQRQEWEAAFRRVLKKWKRRRALSPEEAEFLAMSFAALYDTPNRLIEAGLEKGLGVPPEVITTLLEHVKGLRKSAIEAKNRLDAAFDRQLSATDQAFSEGHWGSGGALKAFDIALDNLKEAVKLYSGTPSHRPQENPERDAAIREMHREGKTYGEIALALRKKNPNWEVTAGQAERADKRNRERGQRQLLWCFRKAFEQTSSDCRSPR